MSVFWTCQLQFCPAGGEFVATSAAESRVVAKNANAVAAGKCFTNRDRDVTGKSMLPYTPIPYIASKVFLLALAP
jgi:hypothetical protein